MASLLSATEKADIQAALDDVHDTFKRAITVYVKKVTAISQTPSDYNPIYNRTKGVQKTVETLVPHTVMARVNYLSTNGSLIDGDGQLALQLDNSRVEIKVAVGDDSELVKKADKIDVDGILYDDFSPHNVMGIFSPKYHVYHLKRE